MKYLKQLIYLMIQFHWKETLLMVILITGSIGAIFESIWVWSLSFLIVIVGEIYQQHRRDKNGLL